MQHIWLIKNDLRYSQLNKLCAKKLLFIDCYFDCMCKNIIHRYETTPSMGRLSNSTNYMNLTNFKTKIGKTRICDFIPPISQNLYVFLYR